MIDLKPLRQFGLHYKDIKVYKAVLSLGKAKSGVIMKESGSGSSSFYSSIELLIEKGLVSYEVKNNVRYYKPEPLESLIERSRETTASLQTLNIELAKLKPVDIAKGDVDVLEGYHGLERAFMEHVDGFTSETTLRIIGFSSQVKERKVLHSFLEKINTVALKKKCKVIILLDEKLKKESNPTQSLKNKKIHYLPSSYFGPIAYNITDSEVMLSIWGKTPTVVRLRNKIVVDSFIKNFNFMISKK